MGRTLQTDGLTLQEQIWQGPATVVLDDVVRVEDMLRPQTTDRWNRFYNERANDFPNLYIQDPFPVLTWNPISTYSNDQNNRFDQRNPTVAVGNPKGAPWSTMSGPGGRPYFG
jgi:hypothetical protein